MKKSFALVIVLVVSAALFSNGCATILSGSTQTITVTSTPAGASVKMANYSGTTPYTVSIPKGKDYPIEITLNSQTEVRTLTRVFDPVGFINILVWPGFIVDAVTGAITKYEPDTVHVNFK